MYSQIIAHTRYKFQSKKKMFEFNNSRTGFLNPIWQMSPEPEELPMPSFTTPPRQTRNLSPPSLRRQTANAGFFDFRNIDPEILEPLEMPDIFEENLLDPSEIPDVFDDGASDISINDLDINFFGVTPAYTETICAIPPEQINTPWRNRVRAPEMYEIEEQKEEDEMTIEIPRW